MHLAFLVLVLLLASPAIAFADVAGGTCCAVTAYSFAAVEQAAGAAAVRVSDGYSGHLGVGVRGAGALAQHDLDTLGGGAELLFRATHHLTVEIAGELQRTVTGGAPRSDIPLTAGLRVHLGSPRWVVSPYLVAAGGVDIAEEDWKVGHEQALYLDGQLGGGLEVRLGGHLALTADARFEGRMLLAAPDVTGPLPAAPASVALHDGMGAALHVGAAVYF